MSDLPDSLQAAARTYTRLSSNNSFSGGDTRVRRGDLRIVRGVPGVDVEPRLVLVLKVDQNREFAEVLLTHTSSDLAHSIDLVLPRGSTPTAYELVIETDLRGVVWTLQLGPLVGRVDNEVFTVLNDGTSENGQIGSSQVPMWGTALLGPTDPRWAFKAEEGRVFRAITSDCTEVLLDDSTWELDTNLLHAEAISTAENAEALIEDLVHWVATRQLHVSADEILLLVEDGALEPDAWSEESDLGLDLLTVLQQMLEEQITKDVGNERDSVLRLVTAEHVYQGEGSDEVQYLGSREGIWV